MHLTWILVLSMLMLAWVKSSSADMVIPTYARQQTERPSTHAENLRKYPEWDYPYSRSQTVAP